ncbi:hypothetical protein OYC64_016760 [Pagothenia borchgrevinki]|uniref:Ig-like domain-containing protein n=1 Tax=Pagothenia borchgrevinki TaxID=8213 RepID=A0ABD2HRL8_PAGBO
MRILNCFTLLLFLSANADNNAVWRASGENVTLRCSVAGCPNSSNNEYDGMFLYLNQYHEEQKEVQYYHSSPGTPDNIAPRERYKGRIQTNGSLNDHTITISRLTVHDSGFYRCVFMHFPHVRVTCSEHTLFIKGVAPCPPAEVPPALTCENHLHLVLIIGAACTVCTIATIIFILLIVTRVRRWVCSRRRATRVARVPNNDYVYEVMTARGLRPALEQSSSSTYTGIRLA